MRITAVVENLNNFRQLEGCNCMDFPVTEDYRAKGISLLRTASVCVLVFLCSL